MDDVDQQNFEATVSPSSFKGEVAHGGWKFDEIDLLLIAMLKDPVLSPEFAWKDPNNVDYSGCYRVRDYQVRFNRVAGQYEAFACARSVGKTERQKIYAFTHFFRRVGQNLLITAPELLHLLPLTDAIEDRIENCRLTRENLKRDKAGATGFSHQPFGVEFSDGTKIVGRIPNRDGRGVKGQHQPDLMVEEGQDYPDAGWTEVHEALALTEQVLTPSGFRDMADIHHGDMVIGVDGRPVKVIGESPVTEREVFEVSLSDGTVVQCDANHLWNVRPRPGRTERTMTTREIMDSGRRWTVPELTSPVEFGEVGDLGIDPYLLGLLLGDGGMTQKTIKFSTNDQELVDAVRSLIPPSDELVHESGFDYRFRSSGGRNRHTRPWVREELDRLGLSGKDSGNKFVPVEYLMSSPSRRLSMLQGLVDSDGNVSAKGAIRYVSVSRRLADDVEFLVRSLGGSCARSIRLDKRGFKDCHTLHFRLPKGMTPARMTRKASVYWPSTVRSERAIVHVGSTRRTTKVKCIKVDDDRGLFLTRNFVVTHNTVLKDDPSFTYHIYGVHRGARGGGFMKRVTGGLFKNHCLTAIMRPGWGPDEKQAAMDTYGGENAPDYRRNILGEPGAASSPLFVTSRLMACVDQDRTSNYNLTEYVSQHLRWEEFESQWAVNGKIPADALSYALDLPSNSYGYSLAGGDLGLTSSPTVISIFGEKKVNGVLRLALIRRITLERFSSRYLREAIRHVFAWDRSTEGIGLDITGLGFPIFQEIQDDEENNDPQLLNAVRGWKFNEKIPVGVDPSRVKDGKDEFGRKVDEDDLVMMTVIEATTRYLREWVDSGYLLLPFDTEVLNDLLAENMQRVQHLSQLTGSKKPNAFHILDSFRMAALISRLKDIGVGGEVERAPVLDGVIGPDVFSY